MKKKYMTMINDVDGLPRAWALAPTAKASLEEAERQWKARLEEKRAEGTVDRDCERGDVKVVELRGRTWKDQPAELDFAEVVTYFHVDDLNVEVRIRAFKWYVTAGDLFSSKTVRCDSAETALRAIRAMTDPGVFALPLGAALVQNDEGKKRS
jgi:hypothetical protein